MNTRLQISNINETQSQSKAISFAATLSKVNSLLKKYGKKANKGFWKYTEYKSEADISSYKGLL